MDKEFTILCDDGEEVAIIAGSEIEAMTLAFERGLKPVEVVRDREPVLK